MRPLDPRLLRYASAARWFLLGGALLGLVQTVTVVAFAWFLSQALVGAIDGRSLTEMAGTIGALALVCVARAVLAWLLEVAASRGAASVKSQLRARVLDVLARRGSDWLAGRQSARVSTVVTTGLDALDNYFAHYLPQLLLTGIATPLIVVVMFAQDFASGITVLVVIPLVPIFMVLIGRATQAVQRQQWEALQRLGTGFLDLVGGLGTLKIFGRERRQFDRLRAISEDYRTRTMKVLRVSFLSGFVLELAASLSVALIAVSIGLRLVDGSLALGVGLFVLLLAPEAFLPLRQVGAQFHAAADGLAAAEEVFAILEEIEGDAGTSAGVPGASGASGASPDFADFAASERATASSLRFDGVTVLRGSAAVIDGFTAEFMPGELAVISGPSGVGKSTLIAALQGIVPFEGRITLGEEVLAAHQQRHWLAWAGQRPGLFSGTILTNVTLGQASVDIGLVSQSLNWAGAAELDPATRLGVNGEGLSGGQAQRVAAARAIYRAQANGCHVVVFDEPSSALDERNELALVDGLRKLASEGRIVIVVSHRPALVDGADRLVRMSEVVHA